MYLCLCVCLGDCMPTFGNLSPLRQSISNPNMKEAADLVLTFGANSNVASENGISTGGGDSFPLINESGIIIGSAFFLVYLEMQDLK